MTALEEVQSGLSEAAETEDPLVRARILNEKVLPAMASVRQGVIKQRALSVKEACDFGDGVEIHPAAGFEFDGGRHFVSHGDRFAELIAGHVVEQDHIYSGHPQKPADLIQPVGFQFAPFERCASWLAARPRRGLHLVVGGQSQTGTSSFRLGRLQRNGARPPCVLCAPGSWHIPSSKSF